MQDRGSTIHSNRPVLITRALLRDGPSKSLVVRVQCGYIGNDGMIKSYYSILILNALALSFSFTVSAEADSGSPSSSLGSPPVTESDFGSAGTGSGANTTTYSIAPNTAYDNMNYQQSNTSAAGNSISDYYNQADYDSAASSGVAQSTSKEIPTSRGGLPNFGTGQLANTMVNKSIQSGGYNLGFSGSGAASAYSAVRGISSPKVSTGSIIMNQGFTPY
jgi:hypothetical protein